MSVKVKCPCGREVMLPDEARGKQVKCPTCSRSFRVPSGSAPGGSAPPRGQAASGTPEPRGAARNGVLIGVGIAVLAVVGVGIVLATRKGDEAEPGQEEVAVERPATQPSGLAPATAEGKLPQKAESASNGGRSAGWIPTDVPPAPASGPRKVTIARERRIVLVDGKPFFALGFKGIHV